MRLNNKNISHWVSKLNMFRFWTMAIMIMFTGLWLSGCGPTRPPEQSQGHINESDIVSADNIPLPVTQTTILPEPEYRPKLETYTVIVSEVPAKELLFSIARDAKINLDIHNDITGYVTLNAIDQTLPQILERISRQVDIRYEIEDANLRVRLDTPFLRSYTIEYVNMVRETVGEIRVASTLESTGKSDISSTSSSGGSSGSSGQGDNSSLTEVKNKSVNAFWETLELNIKQVISKDKSKLSAEVENVIVNKETGIIIVRATQKEHAIIQSFVDEVLGNAKRQVLIEATIAEIELSDRYQAGVDWSLIASNPNDGISFSSNFRDGNLSSSPVSTLTISDIVSGDPLSVTLSALEKFGDVQVLSSPKVMAINNQPAVLKVVDNLVYFETDVETTSNDNVTVTNVETTIKTVPVGFIMSVTPYISADEVVTLNIRPTISRVINSVNDPNPAFEEAGVVSAVPVIQVREIESILQVNTGDTAIIGGLMQDTVNDNRSGVPFLSSLPIIGGLFSYTDDSRKKSELVIFIKPVVIKHASVATELSDYEKYLPRIGKINKRDDEE
ncbi:MAG: pilus (MSHA type) biogenesis protein MshL [Gammaproteobacteria bacterium]